MKIALTVLVAVMLFVVLHTRTGLRMLYVDQVRMSLQRVVPDNAITESDLEPLPLQIKRYLQYVGVTAGQNRVKNFRASFKGVMRKSIDTPWMKFTSEQTSFFDIPSRFYYLRASLFGLPFQAVETYVGSEASMQVKIDSLFRVMDAVGPELNQSETVTLFNDMCFLAPATLISPNIQWQVIDLNRVRATFTNAGNSISAELVFNDLGQLINFTSDDRYRTTFGKTFKKLHWSTPIREYQHFGAYRIGSRGEARWQLPGENDFAYIRLELLKIEYNIKNISDKSTKGNLANAVQR